MNNPKATLLKHLTEIRSDCNFAALPYDINLSLVIEGIDRLADECIAVLSVMELKSTSKKRRSENG